MRLVDLVACRHPTDILLWQLDILQHFAISPDLATNKQWVTFLHPDGPYDYCTLESSPERNPRQIFWLTCLDLLSLDWKHWLPGWWIGTCLPMILLGSAQYQSMILTSDLRNQPLEL